jgi:hypothetical protein
MWRPEFLSYFFHVTVKRSVFFLLKCNFYRRDLRAERQRPTYGGRDKLARPFQEIFFGTDPFLYL